MKDILFSHSSDAKFYANLNNKAKLILELPKHHKCLNLPPELCRWLFSTFPSIITTSFLIKRQTKAFELQLYRLLQFGVVFVGVFSYSRCLKKVLTS